MNWKEIHDRESPALYMHLLARGCTPQLAEDVIHDVFLAAMAGASHILRPRAYLFQAARNVVARNERHLLPAGKLSEIVASFLRRRSTPIRMS